MKVLHLHTGSVLSFRDRKTLSPCSLTQWWRWCALNSNCSTDNSWHYMSMSNVSARDYFVAAGVLFNTENQTQVRESFYSLVPLPFSHFGHLFLLLHVQTFSESGSVLFSAAYRDHIEKSLWRLKKVLNKCAFFVFKVSSFFPYSCLIFPFHPSKQCLHHFICVRKLKDVFRGFSKPKVTFSDICLCPTNSPNSFFSVPQDWEGLKWETGNTKSGLCALCHRAATNENFNDPLSVWVFFFFFK